MDLKQFLIFAILACAVRESSAKLLWVTLLLLKTNKPGTCLNRHQNGARGFLGNYPAFEGRIWWRVVGTTSLGWVVLYKRKFFYTMWWFKCSVLLKLCILHGNVWNMVLDIDKKYETLSIYVTDYPYETLKISISVYFLNWDFFSRLKLLKKSFCGVLESK